TTLPGPRPQSRGGGDTGQPRAPPRDARRGARTDQCRRRCSQVGRLRWHEYAEGGGDPRATVHPVAQRDEATKLGHRLAGAVLDLDVTHLHMLLWAPSQVAVECAPL